MVSTALMVSMSEMVSQGNREGCGLKCVGGEVGRFVLHADLPPLSGTFFLDMLIEFSP